MKTITGILKVSKNQANLIKHYLTHEPKHARVCLRADETITNTVSFPDGVEIDIKCCGVEYDKKASSNTAWTEAVLFKNGNEVTHTDPESEYFGEWYLEYNGIRYKIVVEENISNDTISYIRPADNEQFTYDIVLCEKPGEDGLNFTEVRKMYDKLNEFQAYPIEIPAKEHESSAMGFITPKAADKLDFEYDGLNNFIASILDDMKNENPSHEYEYKDLSIYLAREF